VRRVDTRDAVLGSVAEARRAGARIGFVPTMGGLHEGHLRLFDRAAALSDFVVASVFVNPLQFGPAEDLDRYPRDIERDARLAADRAVDLLFSPGVAEMYPSGSSRVLLRAPALTRRLCGPHRLGHFEGVLTVVAKLFNIVRPDVAVFGQKDYQQAVLVRSMARDLDFGIDIDVMPTMREPDGLAMSSRNARLSPDERQRATVLWRALVAAQAAFAAGERRAPALVALVREIVTATPGVQLQYAEAAHPDTLADVERAEIGTVLAVAAFVADTRLIDNHVLT
jgi:pantoate--beta-alanine ligase